MWGERRKNSGTNKKKRYEHAQLVNCTSAWRLRSCYTIHEYRFKNNGLQTGIHSSPMAVTLAEEGRVCMRLLRGSEDILILLWMRSLVIKNMVLACFVKKSQGIGAGPRDGHCGEMYFDSIYDSSF